jgi:hypothetical protein
LVELQKDQGKKGREQKTPSKKSETKLLIGVNEFKGVVIERGLVEGVKERERERERESGFMSESMKNEP